MKKMVVNNNSNFKNFVKNEIIEIENYTPLEL